MKIFYFLISVLSLLHIGCSSTYTVADFPSKDNFYEDFNKLANNKPVEITLNNDSAFTAADGARISNDSLIITLPVLKREKVINKDDVKDITFSIHNMTNTILLKSDQSITAGNIEILPDSSVAVYNYVDTYKYLSLIHVKKIIYKNHWLGVPLPSISGAVIGFLITIFGGQIYLSSSRKNQIVSEYDYLFSFSAAGLLIGGIWGGIDGWAYIYEFSP
jgi:hypothetical protein